MNIEQVEEEAIYTHYKGGVYYVHFVAQHTESDEKSVVYQKVALMVGGEFCLSPQRPWYRPLASFCSQVEVDGKMVNRFTLLERPL